MDRCGTSDPFVTLKLQDKTRLKRTSIVKKTLDPTWHESFDFGSWKIENITCWNLFNYYFVYRYLFAERRRSSLFCLWLWQVIFFLKQKYIFARMIWFFTTQTVDMARMIFSVNVHWVYYRLWTSDRASNGAIGCRCWINGVKVDCQIKK